MSFILGIDPGKKGGLCIISAKGEVVYLESIPIINEDYNLEELSDFFSFWKDKIGMAYLEKQWGYPRQSSITTFEQGRGYGILQGMLESWGIITEIISAKTWQAGIYKGYPFPDEIDAKDKAFIIAQDIYPEVSFIRGNSKIPKDGLIDSLLIANFGLGRSGSIQASLHGIQ